MNWKCSNCGYTFEAETDKLPDKCPSCGEKCTFLDATCYTPECSRESGGTGIDPRIKGGN